MIALLRTLHLTKSVRAVDVLDLRPEAIQPLADRITNLLPSPILTNGALARSLVSGGVVNRSVVNKKHASRPRYAPTIGAEQHSCLARKPLETFGTIRAKGGER